MKTLFCELEKGGKSFFSGKGGGYIFCIQHVLFYLDLGKKSEPPKSCWVDCLRGGGGGGVTKKPERGLTRGRGKRTANLHVFGETTSREKCLESM